MRSIGLAMLLALVGSPAWAADWPQLQHDSQHSGHTEDAGPTGGKVLWEFDLNRELVGKCAQPIIMGGRSFSRA